jgi:hypothetical protein
VVYVASASHGDNGPYHGWILGYSAANLGLVAAFNTTPNGSDGGVWMSGGKINVGANGNLYLTTGNGTFETTTVNGRPSLNDYGDAVLELAVDPSSSSAKQNGNGWGLKVVDYFVPFNQATLNAKDLDFGSSPALILPPSVGSASHQNLIFTGGKEGRDYLLDQNNLGKFNATADAVVQSKAGLGSIYSPPAYFNGKIYVAPNGGSPETFNVGNAFFAPFHSSVASENVGFPGATVSISGNGNTNDIAWIVDLADNQLQAFSANGFNQELFAGSLGASANKFTPPTIADGEVFVGTQSSLVIFGLGGSAPKQPIANGKYVLTDSYDNQVLDDYEFSKTAGSIIDQWTANGGTNQQWNFTYQGLGFYTITNAYSGLFLGDPGSSTKRGTDLEQLSADGGADELWSLTANDGGYIIQNDASGLVIDDIAHSTTMGNVQDLWTDSNYQWQIWDFS